MAKFIKLTYPDNSETWINIDHIIAFEHNTTHGFTDLVLMLIGTAQVKETPTQILAKFP